MQEPSQAQSAEDSRLYVYCVLGSPRIPGRRFLEKAAGGALAVVTTPELAAVVGPAPDSLDQDTDVVTWVERHARTVDLIRQACPDVLPLRMGTMFKGPSETAARSGVSRWLEVEHDRLLRTLGRIRGRDEYGVEAWCRRDALAAHLSSQDLELEALQAAAQVAGTGAAYLLRARFERMLGQRSDEFAKLTHEALMAAMRGSVQDVTAARLPRGSERETDAVPLLALSALVERSRVADFVAGLEALEFFPDVRLRLTGPWPPYSFVDM